MSDQRHNLLEQIEWEPTVVGVVPRAARATLVGGMGGSHLAAGLLGAALPEMGLAVHHDYGLPALPEGAMAIAVSHSGNTEETLDFARAAHGAGVLAAAVGTGGALIEYAAAQGVAHVVLPQGSQPPRLCVGYHAVALLTLMDRMQELGALRAAARAGAAAESDVARLVAHLQQGVPLIYSSARNEALVQYIKVQLNETAKMPAFVNTFPELNHNEMQATLRSPDTFRVVLVRDLGDDPRVIKRMDAFAGLAQERGVEVVSLELPAEPYAKLVDGIVLAQELALALAHARQVDPNDTAIIEEFKKRIA